MSIYEGAGFLESFFVSCRGGPGGFREEGDTSWRKKEERKRINME